MKSIEKERVEDFVFRIFMRLTPVGVTTEFFGGELSCLSFNDNFQTIHKNWINIIKAIRVGGAGGAEKKG